MRHKVYSMLGSLSFHFSQSQCRSLFLSLALFTDSFSLFNYLLVLVRFLLAGGRSNAEQGDVVEPALHGVVKGAGGVAQVASGSASSLPVQLAQDAALRGALYI